MEGWLPIEQHHISILQVALHLVAWLQMDVTVLAPVPQVHTLPILSDDETCSGLPWRGMRAILHKLLQPAPKPAQDHSISQHTVP